MSEDYRLELKFRMEIREVRNPVNEGQLFAIVLEEFLQIFGCFCVGDQEKSTNADEKIGQVFKFDHRLRVTHGEES